MLVRLETLRYRTAYQVLVARQFRSRFDESHLTGRLDLTFKRLLQRESSRSTIFISISFLKSVLNRLILPEMKVEAKLSPCGSAVVPPRDDRGAFWSFLIAAILFVTTAAVYSPARQNGFVEWDDQLYVYEQPRVLEGLNPDSVLWAMTANVCANWHPLTVISLQTDAQLFGPGPLGFHLTAVLLHATNAVLAFLAIFGITGCRWRSAIVAALFAFHPTRVESVAWISERKGLLSGLFFFLTLIAYARFVRAPSTGRYLLVAFFLALGLSAKSILVTTPCVLLLLDYWPLRRCPGAPNPQWPCVRKLIIEKLPLLGLAAISSLLTVSYQQIAIIDRAKVPFSERIENAARACASYLVQTCWPLQLSHFYPFPPSSTARFLAALFFCAALTALAIWQRNRRPYLLVGWLWFLGMLIPVCGLIQVGFQQRADRYLYLSQIGLILAAVWGLADLVRGSRPAKIAMVCLLAGCLMAGGFLTVRQISVWHDTRSLWQHAYLMNPHNPPALFYLMDIAFSEDNRAEAVRLADELIRVEDRRHHEFLMRVYEKLVAHDEFEASVRAIDRALEFGAESGFPKSELLCLRGESRAAQGRWQDAVDDYRTMIIAAPNAVPLQFCLAHALARIGQREESERVAAAALQQFPQFPMSAVMASWQVSMQPEATRIQRCKAVWLAEEANAVTGGQHPAILDVLAAAYAANDQFQEAVSTAEFAVQRAEAAGDAARAEAIRSRLKLYRAGQPYRE